MFKVRHSVMLYNYYLCNSQTGERLDPDEIATLAGKPSEEVISTLSTEYNCKIERDCHIVFQTQEDAQLACDYLHSIIILDKLTI